MVLNVRSPEHLYHNLRGETHGLVFQQVPSDSSAIEVSVWHRSTLRLRKRLEHKRHRKDQVRTPWLL